MPALLLETWLLLFRSTFRLLFILDTKALGGW
jgi:hypothetical protein